MIMADEYEVTDVGEMLPHPDSPCFYVTMRQPDGLLRQHVFPRSTFEWRAAEYGLTDPTEILDVILHEPHRPRVQSDDRVSLSNPAKKATPAEDEPVTLWTAKSTSEAREAHRKAIGDIKAKRRVTDPSAHLALIAGLHGMDPARIRAKAERVDTTRWIKQYGDLPAKPIPKEAPRA